MALELTAKQSRFRRILGCCVLLVGPLNVVAADRECTPTILFCLERATTTWSVDISWCESDTVWLTCPHARDLYHVHHRSTFDMHLRQHLHDHL